MNVFDRISDASGRLVSWLTVFMVIMTVVIVVMRKLFDAGHIWMQESVTWMHAAVFMLGAAYTLQRDGHVRVDIFYRKMSERGQAMVDLLGTVLFLFPVCAFLAYSAFDFAAASWEIHEISREPGGLPYPAIPILKSVVVIMPVALALQGVSMVLRCIAVLRGR